MIIEINKYIDEDLCYDNFYNKYVFTEIWPRYLPWGLEL